MAVRVQDGRILSLDCPSATHPDTAALAAARRYAALQPFIVDKRPLFSAMVELVERRVAPPDRVVELGVGTGGFLEFAARAGVWPRATLVGADASPARIEVAQETMATLGRAVTLCAGVNAMDATDSFFRDVVPPGSADVVVLAQFEHYAANDDDSPLARRLSLAGKAWCTKAALRRLAWSRLRPGGWLFVVDDYGAGTAEMQAQWDRAWDAHVVRELSGEAAWRALERRGAVAADARVRGYHPSRPMDDRLALAARARARRRHRDGEEVQGLRAARDDFREIFGSEHHGCLPHPVASAYPQFHLLWGWRAP